MSCAVILTAIPSEYMAVRAHLTDLKEEIHPQGTIYERGKFSSHGQEWEVGIVETGAGNFRAAVEAERAIAYFNPDVILFVGVAGGIKDVKLGDVVAATKVYGYESGKVAETFRPRPEVGLSTYKMIQGARAEARKPDWLERLSSSASPKVFVAPIAAGEKVVANKESDLFKFLQHNYGDALAVEIEGRGILQATHANQQVSALIIRGISDLIDGKGEADEGGYKETAAGHASAFAFEVLAKLELNSPAQALAATELIKKTKTPKFFAYVQAWVGRESLINDLTNKLKGSCRLLILLGITGIGKTALGERLALELEDWFEDWNSYLQENFDNEEQTADFGSVAARLLEKCGEVVTPDDPKDTQRLMYRLVRHLQENRYLIQIDSLENLLQGNEEEGWSDFIDEWWVKFFQTWLTVDTCESCFILTSDELPAQIPIIGTRYQNFWYCQPLSGLDEPEQLALFGKTGLDITEEAEGKPYLERIGRAYEGHPLALRVIAGEIVNRPFYGNVIEYWNKNGKEVEEVEKAIEEGKTKGITASADDQFNLHKYTPQLRRNVKVRLEKEFNRLKEKVPEAYLLLCASSVYRCEVPEDFWLSHLEDWDIDEDRQQMALDALRDRYLVEETVDDNNQYLLRQHNLIRSLSLEHLRGLDDEE
ncbi:phosphorylase family protein [Moorena bouillonii]|uniref:Phosphorylase n=1 Tax=Moorena bouillonii PNG TaxID=568701 RepID=A0A1U7N3U3_9CYAN|nr:phosphorylase [Moorena bouillonii]OLT60596.1 phosphorylase [Moorena bouillonii PNG]